LTYAWLGALGSEYFMRSGAGIGGLMINAQQLARMDIVIGAMVLVGLSGALLHRLGEIIETRATRWRTASLPA
jgi:sulfonate transport system permease protein